MNILPTCKRCGRKTPPFVSECDSCQADDRRKSLEAAQMHEEWRKRQEAEKRSNEEVEAAVRRKAAMLRNPLPTVALRLVDNETTFEKRFTAAQIRSLFLNASLSAEAQFEHPHYPGEWVSCLELFDTTPSGSEVVQWDYYIQHLKISGASSGIISAFTEKGLKGDSSGALARLGAEGWELTAVLPVTTGAVGAVWSDSAIAFLKRKRG